VLAGALLLVIVGAVLYAISMRRERIFKRRRESKYQTYHEYNNEIRAMTRQRKERDARLPPDARAHPEAGDDGGDGGDERSH
jgi:hypothetical protein